MTDDDKHWFEWQIAKVAYVLIAAILLIGFVALKDTKKLRKRMEAIESKRIVH